MTRCIHCSRCVRFGEEIAGIKELGMTGRGEDTKIETYLNHGLSSELSGNVIDLCPVGALNNTLYKYSARTWDLTQLNSISTHDCIGSNIYYHTYKNEIKRCIPKENDTLNLSWLSDRDRYGYEGIKSKDRILEPLVKLEDKLIKTSNTDIAEKFTSDLEKIISSDKKSNILATISAQSSCEEMYLFQKILRELNINNIDHRTKENDTKYQKSYPIVPSLGINLSDLTQMDNIILVDVDITKEFPILSIYMRDAIKENSTKIYKVSSHNHIENFDIENSLITSPNNIAKVFSDSNDGILKQINKNTKNAIILGPSATFHENYSYLLNTISKYAKAINASLGFLGDQSNTAGAWAMGVIPHRFSGGKDSPVKGYSYTEAINKEIDALIIYNLEPEYDFFDDNKILSALKKSKLNIFFSSFMTSSIEKYADIVFPLSVPQESSGTFINATKQVQTSHKIVKPKESSLEGLDHLINISSNLKFSLTRDEIKRETKSILTNIKFPLNNYISAENIKTPNRDDSLHKVIIRSPNSNNPLLRRCKSLLSTHDDNDYISFPKTLNLGDSKTTIILENSDKLKLSLKNKMHDLPENVILVNISGVHNQKIGARDSIVSVD